MPIRMPNTETINSGKNLVSLLRDLLLLALALLLLIFPGTFNQVLVKAGFEEGSIVGIKWKKSVIAANNELKVANETIKTLQLRLDSTMQLLARTQQQVPDTGLSREIDQLTTDNKTVLRNTAAVAQTVSNTLRTNKAFVERAERETGTSTEWGIVYGTDKTLEAAQYEAGPVARKLGITDAAIYLRQGWYQTVAITTSRDEADALLRTAKKRRADAFIVLMDKWCPNHQPEAGYELCQ